MTAEAVRSELDSGVLRVMIDRPEQRNALNADVNRGLLAALDRLRDDDGATLMVLTGAGEKAFCAGADLGGLNPEAGALALHRGRSLFADVLRRMRSVPKPIVGRVNGHALAGGFGLALGCDLLGAAPAPRGGGGGGGGPGRAAAPPAPRPRPRRSARPR